MLKIFLFQGGDSNARVSSRRTEEPHIGKYRLLKTIGKGNFAKVRIVLLHQRSSTCQCVGSGSELWDTSWIWIRVESEDQDPGSNRIKNKISS